MQPPSVESPDQAGLLPDHTQLPDKDGTFVRNFQEHPQTILLRGSLMPRLQELHPDGQFCVGCDCGIYWRSTQPPLDGCKAPDWFYVPNVPPMLDGRFRRSYVLWHEVVRPLLVIEYVSGDGSEERDTTPYRGKFWVYEQGIGAPYYAIFEGEKSAVEVHELRRGRYQRVEPNAADRFPVEPLGIELGIWQGTYLNMNLPWLRVWNSSTGQLLPTYEERAEAERRRAQDERQRAEDERSQKENAESLLDDARRRLDEECERAENERKEKENERRQKEKLAERLRALGVDPNTV
jgi:Uma2 family endonuclease